EAFRLLQTWRDDPALRGLRFEGGFFEKKFGAQLALADRLKAAHCVLLGEDELAKNELTLKTLKTGQQQRVAFSDALRILTSLRNA
ncbi:MAG TPA: His/Gly/Thr/Pro-type tRNA ligase C-terminal domain-containing protein, partial [Elusimicrobiota bacterium]|nr:His/Gly/Thr/Pro-type tRNA ligase C-terminal domain-containing protein [Elusimicrobiota bacterium]